MHARIWERIGQRHSSEVVDRNEARRKKLFVKKSHDFFVYTERIVLFFFLQSWETESSLRLGTQGCSPREHILVEDHSPLRRTTTRVLSRDGVMTFRTLRALHTSLVLAIHPSTLELRRTGSQSHWYGGTPCRYHVRALF